MNERTTKERNTKPGESPQVWRFQFAEGGEGGAALVLGGRGGGGFGSGWGGGPDSDNINKKNNQYKKYTRKKRN